MNIQLQLCGLIIVVFLLILFKTHRTLNLSDEKVFTQMLVLTIVCIFLDGLSVFAIRYRSDFPNIVMQLSCKAYLISMIWVGMIDFSYVSLDLSTSALRHKRLVNIMSVVTVIESFVIAALPLHVYDDGKSIYSMGPSVIATYVFTLIYIFSILNVAIYIRKRSSSRRGQAVIMTTSLWILAAAVQFMNNALLVVGFSMAIGIMILYIVMENPDGNLDRSLGCFNPYALDRYVSMKLDKKTPFYVMDISVSDPKTLEDRGIDIVHEARKVASHVMKSKNLKLFKNLSAGFVVVSDDKNAFGDISDYIHKQYSQYDNIDQSLLTFIVDDAQQFENSDELLRFLNYVRNNSSGRMSSTVYVSDEMINDYQNIKKTEDAINLALKEDRVEAFLQPIYSLEEERVVSAEALIRIRSKDGSLMSPAQFVPVAEASGQICDLGERVLEKVCDFLNNSEAISLGIKNIHVNLSVVQCSSTNSVAPLQKIVEQYGVDPEYINFEITETAVSSAKDILLENMNALVGKGFRFALDDFGKGESNLMYIVEMPVSLLKLDMDMSKAFFKNTKARIVVGAVSDMAGKMSLPIVAEGIETKDEVEDIKSGGVTHIQGYYYSRPLPMDEFIEYLKNAQKNNAESNAAAEKAADTADDNRIVMNGKRVLLVDDNELNLEIAEAILEEAGFDVETAMDGIEAVEMVSKCDTSFYDLILMDIRMPIMDGYEATRRIRQLPDKRQAFIPIVALTASSGDETLKAAMDAGMNAHLEKPLDMEKLKSLLQFI